MRLAPHTISRHTTQGPLERSEPPGSLRSWRRRRLRFEWLEDRTLLSTLLVTNSGDSGPGSLRQAILDSNAAIGQESTIDFAISGGDGVYTIEPTRELPSITQPVLIDGLSQPGYAGEILIELDGSLAGTASGLTITGSGVTVRGLDITGFSQGAGVLISGTAATANVITANNIGTDPTGAQALPNYFGVRILGGAHDNLIGGTTAAAGNLIAFNTGQGVSVEGDGTVGNRIIANRIFANEASPTPTPAGMLQFDGSSFVRLPEDLITYQPRPAARTIESWFQTTSGGVILGCQKADPFMNPTVSQAPLAPLLYVGSDGKLYGSIFANAQRGSPVSSDTAVNDGRWHHAAMVFSRSTLTLFLDGRQAGPSDNSRLNGPFFDQIGTGYTFPSDPSTPGGWFPFKGQIDDVQIWRVARSADEVLQDMTTALTGAEPNLDAYYPFDEGQGLTAHDLSPNHRDAMLAGKDGHLPTWSSTSGVAIDLGGDGTTANAASTRQGPNNLQNYPIIVTAVDGQLQGWLDGGMPNSSYHVEFFASAGYAPGGAGQAEVFVGSLEVTTDGQGQAIFDVPFSPLAGKPVVSATATDPQGNTSEISAQRRASVEVPVQTMRLDSAQPLSLSAAAGDALVLRDPQAGQLDPAWDLGLSVTAGTLKLSEIDGLNGSGDGIATLHYRGALSALNAALAGLLYTPPPGFRGNATLDFLAESPGIAPLGSRLLISDGQFLVTTTADSGPGSLRQAILDSNAATGGTNTIDFAIPGQGVQTIALASPLPAITNPVLIDGSSQPGYSSTALVAIDASSSGTADGLIITGADVTIRGLVNGGFALGAGNLSDGLNLQSGPLQANQGGHVGRVDTYRIDTTSDGRLLVQLHSHGLVTRLSLLDAQGRTLVASDGLSPTNADNAIDQHVPAGTYFLKAASSGASGDYALTATLTPATPPFQPIPVGLVNSLQAGYDPLVVGDFNGDRILDLASVDGVHLGLEDGTFRQPSAGLGLSAANPAVFDMISGDFNGDGKLDLVVDELGWIFRPATTIFLLLGNGDGTFQAPKPIATGSFGAMVAGDFTGHGHLDLTVVNPGENTVSVFLGRGDGTFQAPRTYPVGASSSAPQTSAIVPGDFTGDGHLDLAVTNCDDNTVSILLGNGDGTFQPQVTYPAGNGPGNLVVGDFNGDGHLDLVVVDSIHVNGRNPDNAVSVLVGNGDGTFRPAVEYPVGSEPFLVVAGDFTGDGHLDLAVTDSLANPDISVLLGNGDGTFQAPKRMVTDIRPLTLVAGDFNRDGHLDLAAADYFSNFISVLLGNGDGAFAERPGTVIGPAAIYSYNVVTGDFNGDGKLDLAVPRGDNSISVLLGNGDGTFQPQIRVRVDHPGYLWPVDFNGDGRLDLAVLSYPDIWVLPGNGDGTFQSEVEYAELNTPGAFALGDFNGNHKLDFAMGSPDSSAIRVLLRNADGTFQTRDTPAPGLSTVLPYSYNLTGDFNGDGKLDLLEADFGNEALGGTDPGGVLYVFLGNGDGTFQPAKQSVGLASTSYAQVVADDFNGDGKLDLALSLQNPDNTATVSVLLGNGDGTFQPPETVATGISGSNLAAGDFDGDGKPDLYVVGGNSDGAAGVWVLLGNGDGTFQPARFCATAETPLVAGDFKGDGKLDLAVLGRGTTVSALLGNGDGTFTDPGLLATSPHAAPLLADVNGDGTDDVFVVDGAGSILCRQGIPGHPGTFDPPITINPGFPSRDIAWVSHTDSGPLLASVDAKDDAVSLYAWRNGSFIRLGSLATGRLPAQISAADLRGDGRTDLVVRNAADGTLSVFFGTAFDRSKVDGPINPQFIAPSFLFLPPVTLPAGIGVSDVQAADTTGNARLDLVVTNKLTGQVTILRNLGGGAFAAPEPYRAGTSLSAIDTSSGAPVMTSQESTSGVATGPITPGLPSSLVTINPGTDTMGVLAGLGGGRFANAVALQTQNVGQVIRMADFNHDGIPDLAVLTAAGVSIYLGDGKGGFSSPVTYDAGPGPTGLTIADLNRDGNPDLLIGNAYGDVLVLLGNGDGTLRPYRKADQAVALAVADLTGSGKPDFIYADQALDRVVVQYGTDQTQVVGDQATGLLAPGAVKLADMNGDGIPDLIVANSGSNNVLVYPGLGNGQFGPATNGGHGYFVGTNPTGIAVANLNGQPDLVVANSGSNDVSILLGQGTGASWTLTPGPRIKTDAGPVAVALGNILGKGNIDLAVANQQANDVQVFPGVGGGFFNDQAPKTYAVGQAPDGLFVGNFTGAGTDIAALNGGSNTISLIGPSGVIETIPAGGLRPSSGFEGDFTDNGFSDLVVGSTGSGVFSLFLGGAGGLTLSQSFTSEAVPSPTSLSFAGVSEGVISFYAASAGREAASLLAFNTNQQGTVTGVFSGEGLAAATIQSAGAVLASATTGVFQQVAQLLGQSGSALDLIAPLFTVSVIPVEFETQSTGGSSVALLANFLPGTGSAVVQGLTQSQPESTSGGDAAAPQPRQEQAPDDHHDDEPSQPLWERIATGIDRAWEELRNELLKKAGVRTEAADRAISAPSQGKPPAPIHDQSPPPRDQKRRSTHRETSSKPQIVPATLQPAADSRPTRAASTDAIDAAIEELSRRAGETHQELPISENGGFHPPYRIAAPGTFIALTVVVDRVRRHVGRVNVTHKSMN
jgi:hypothetical protein